MAESMVEKVARAMQHGFAVFAGGQEWTGPIEWDDFTDAEQDRFRTVARAAIEAMRDPSEAMVQAGAQQPGMRLADHILYVESIRAGKDSLKYELGDSPLVQAYRAMIDAALSHKGEEG